MATATYVPIATTTLGSANANITFSSISNTYTDLKIVLVGNITTSTANVALTFNSDTAGNYSVTWLDGNGTSATTNSITSLQYISLGVIDSGSLPAFINADIFSYAGSTFKSTLSTDSKDQNGSGTVRATVGMWRSTNAITSINLGLSASTFTAGTTATLYGILKA